MPYIPFHNICLKIAKKETRVITILENYNEFDLPKGEYVFIELFCDECDCRRVFLQVFMNKKIAATISYGWEELSFYEKEFEGVDGVDMKEFKGPSLDSFQYQSNISKGILKMFDELLFLDKEYLGRIEKHYNEFKNKLKTTKRITKFI